YHRFCDDPEEAVNYTNCHDGLTLWDKIKATLPNASEEERIKTNQLGIAIVLTSQGKAFFQGGEEMLRSKPDPDNPNGLGVSWNTHDQGDLCNQLDWSKAVTYRKVIDYYRGLIELRKNHQAFRMETETEIQKGLTFINENIDFLIAYKLKGRESGDPWDQIIVIYNANRTAQTLNIPEINPHWKVVVDGNHAGVVPLEKTEVKLGQGFITVPPVAAVVIYSKKCN
ncbi:MAG: alpha-1,6-glucosidase domain-containing protein, partial [Bacillota bacterium]